eukprot:4988218-Pyramimonas_sp.AAC.1
MAIASGLGVTLCRARPRPGGCAPEAWSQATWAAVPQRFIPLDTKNATGARVDATTTWIPRIRLLCDDDAHDAQVSGAAPRGT